MRVERHLPSVIVPMPVILDNDQPERDLCSWCKEHAVFVRDEDGDFVSECCDAGPISVDVELEDR